MISHIKKQKGSMLILTLVTTGLFLVLLMGAITTTLLQQKLNIRKVASAQSLHIAEAGVNYYRWVLYHDHEEYCNKEACRPAPNYGPYGPYAYMDSAGESITGYYELYITPPALNGSTIVKIKSVGWEATHPTIKRTIEVNCGISSWSTYSTLGNSSIRFGEGTEVWGPIHSNGGIRFDGVAHNVISSSLLNYDDPDHSGANEFGVHTHVVPVDPLPDGNNPPENVPDRSDVFIAGRQFPVPVVSFDLLNSYISDTYAKATSSSGILFDGANSGTADSHSVAVFWGCAASGNSCDEGFHIKLKTNHTFDIRGVSAVYSTCSSDPSNSILTEEATARNYAIPANGIIFVKGMLWVDGQINGSRVTILAFKDPLTGSTADINVNNDILYTNYDSTDSIGLIAQNDVNVGQYSEDDLRIDAGLIAKTGRIGREYYSSSCTNYIRDKITVFGSLATNNRYGFAYTDGTGYQIRNLIYDNNLTFSPPPHYPTTGEYTFISWREE
jgi:hypothetical protein